MYMEGRGEAEKCGFKNEMRGEEESGSWKNVNRGEEGEDEPEGNGGENEEKQTHCGADEDVIRLLDSRY